MVKVSFTDPGPSVTGVASSTENPGGPSLSRIVRVCALSLGEINPPAETIPNPRMTVSLTSLSVSPVTADRHRHGRAIGQATDRYRCRRGEREVRCSGCAARPDNLRLSPLLERQAPWRQLARWCPRRD